MIKRIVLINGPAQSGKDSLAKFMMKAYSGGSVEMKMAAPIVGAMVALFGENAVVGNYESFKTTNPLPAYDVTGRQAMIDFSEDYLKKTFDPMIFADLLLAKVGGLPEDVDTVFVSDSGFQLEYDTVYLWADHEDVEVILIRVSRPGHSFSSNDSREKVFHRTWGRGGAVYDIANDGLLDYLESKARTLVHHVMKTLQS
jgi:hypothetical protein